MIRKKSFLITFCLTLLLVISGGLLLWREPDRNNFPEVKHFPYDLTSINSGQKDSDTTSVMSPSVKPMEKQSWYQNQVVVLTYHHITNDSNQRYVISPDQFAEHMAFLHENNLQPISLKDFLRFVDTGLISTENAVLITFDDGYESYYTHAIPILKQYHFPSVNFLITSRLRDTVEQKRNTMTTPLTLQQVKELLASGLVEVGSHTYSLHEQETVNEWGDLGPETAPVYQEDLQRLEKEQEYKDRLYVDFTMSRVALSNLAEQQVGTISFPFGFANETVIKTAQQAGFSYAFNSFPDVVRPGVRPFEIPRFDVGLREVDVTKLRELFTKAKLGSKESDHEQSN